MVAPNHDRIKQEYRVVIPAGIELPKGVCGAKLASLLQYVLTLTCLTKERRHQAHYVNVHSDRWESLLSSGYRAIVDRAVSDGYIEVNERYSDGSRTLKPYTKSIRLTKQFRNGKAQVVTINNKPAINRLAKSWEPDACLLYTSPSPRDKRQSRMPSSA